MKKLDKTISEVWEDKYVVPLYQRNFAWTEKEINLLLQDVYDSFKKAPDSNYYIGSLVVLRRQDGTLEVIDGQQRLTTVTLLLLAISNLVKAGHVHSEEEDLDDQIIQRFIIAPWAKKDDKIKLRPVREDRAALEKLFGPADDYDRGSNMTINYQFFYDQILKEEVTVD